MKIRHSLLIGITTILLGTSHLYANNSSHPCLTLTTDDVVELRKGLNQKNLFCRTVESMKKRIDSQIKKPIVVPIPKDAGGGYTHEQHKRNYMHMYEAGLLYQLYQEKAYAKYIKDMLLKYAEIYPTLPLHPVMKSKYRGKLFWQGLNECVWLVYTAQAYDCIYSYLSQNEKEKIETRLFRPMVKFLAVDNRATFEKIHNHGTWSVAAVGMISYVMGDKEMVEESIMGPEKNGKAGFLRQIHELFSPDGYFAEGPYYQRYSLQPFITFAEAIENNEPERKIFEYKNQVLIKAVTTLLQMTQENGEFFHLNDALQKNWKTVELVWGVDIAYEHTKDPTLLSIAREQKTVMVSRAGYEVATNLHKAQPFAHKTLHISDGPDGKNGGIDILRISENDATSIVHKYTTQGMGHGHFDKLSLTFYDNNNEILQDYGAVRFLNIEQKEGGHYLPENNTFAKQTIAHNTLVVDKKSHYKGNLKRASKYSPIFYAFDQNDSIKMSSAFDTTAVPGVKMQRSIFLLNISAFKHPFVVDLFKANSKTKHTYDLPFYYKGQFINANYKYKANKKTRKPFGEKNGYQHLWIEAKSDSLPQNPTITWLNDGRFYTLTMTADSSSTIYFNRIGANDPNFNLRYEPCIVMREQNVGKRTFASTIEIHGVYDPQNERTSQSKSSVKSIKMITDTDEYTIVEIQTIHKKNITICMSNLDASPKSRHKVDSYKWKGVYGIFIN